MHTIKQNILILSIATLLAGCGGGGSSADSSNAAAPSISNTSIKALHEGQVKDSVTGEGLQNVDVSIGSQTTTTDTEGYYTFSNLIETEETVVNFKKEGYLLGSKKIQIKALSGDDTQATNYLEYTMNSYDYQWNYDSQSGTINNTISIPDSDYINFSNEPYTDTITAQLEILDMASHKSKSLFPGSFRGIDSNGEIKQFISYGLISLSLNDTNGNSLDFEDGTVVTLTFDTVSSSEEQNTIPLWYYDSKKGLWIEEGYAERQEDGTYQGEITHTGEWSLNKPIETEPGIFRAHIIDENGLAISDVRLQAIGENWTSDDLSTDENGLFEIEVIPGEDFQFSAYNYKEKYGATYDFIIPAIASGDVVEY